MIAQNVHAGDSVKATYVPVSVVFGFTDMHWAEREDFFRKYGDAGMEEI